MKSTKRIAGLFALTVIIIFSLTAAVCGGRGGGGDEARSGGGGSLSGTYVMDQINETMTVAGLKIPFRYNVSLTFNPSGTYTGSQTMTTSVMGIETTVSDLPFSGTYTVSGSTITMTGEGSGGPSPEPGKLSNSNRRITVRGYIEELDMRLDMIFNKK